MKDTDVRIKKGSIIYKRGEECHTMYILRSGKVGLYLNYGKQDQYKLLSADKVGTSLGEMGLLEGMPRNATAVAEEDITLSVITEDGLYEYISENPEDGARMFKDLAHRFKIVTDELVKTQELLLEVNKEEGGKEKTTLREKLKKLADLLLDVPKDVPPDLYMDCYNRNHSNLL